MSQDLIYLHTDDVLSDSQHIIEAANHAAYNAVDRILVVRNWLLGKRISEENMTGTRSERYGEKIIPELSKQVKERYGKGFDKRSLYQYVKFYQLYPEIVGTVSSQSQDTVQDKIVATVSPQSFETMLVSAFKIPPVPAY